MKTATIHDLELECGEVLSHVELGYTTSGTYDAKRSNAILVCHALTGDSQAVRDGDKPGWWDGLIGPGKAVDTNQYYVICSNVLGGCYGSTGPASINPATGKPYGTSFPVVSVRDMVKAQYKLVEQLGITKLYAVIGGSMGGMQVYEWAVQYPTMMELVMPIATCAHLSAMAIAYNDVARQAIRNDPDWRGGHYYPEPGPIRGLSTARMVGMITYRTAELFEERFGRTRQRMEHDNLTETTFEVESYLRYQGDKLVQRFDANSYLYLLKAMDTHDIGRGRNGLEEALDQIQAKIVCISIANDLLYPVQHQMWLSSTLKQQGKDVDFYTIDSIYGHDGFLVEFETMAQLVGPYFPVRKEVESSQLIGQ
ncbi:homoserine O-acetyltransferase MetX [Brevibacillus daliensis]|uniref:homoserine O-acetyltransferase MetX n=1 Tax=Brevibacillus daliensis TaxID=2892995 RepID=UPI001E2A7F0D|nr:homoserine O-acetyltransferase [Brevibacillus daliensis]